MKEAGNIYSTDERIEQIYSLLIKYTQGDFIERGEISEKGDELDAIIVGLNILGEELQSSGRILSQFETRVNATMNILLSYTLMDFSEKLEITGAGDEMDAIAVGLNTLAEELGAAKEKEKESIEKLEKKTNEVLRLNAALEENIHKLEVANKELEAFTYSVSHDLRAPLRAIHSYTKILSDEYLSGADADGKNMMNSVMRNAKKMGQLIDDLLAFSKVGKKELQLSNVDMTKLAENVLEDLKASMSSCKANVKVLSLPQANADYNLMGNVLGNLISNAIKYSSAKENSEVEIGCKEMEGKQVYYVKDNGAGFDMKYYDKLFGVFQRLHGADEFEGTGVGLALVKRIVTRHGGKIWAEGKLDEGATFYFSL
ncbi:MAG: ATP-binding protein [Bacteroidota bacterium]|nr:ATP-binding protein [Bacteroidota bacterium]